MSITLDLNILPESRFAGSDHPELIGLHIAESPRKAARGRSDDRLLLYLVTVGNALIPPAKQERVLSDLAKLYFNTPGSVTSGMRAVAKALNELLLDRNLRISKSGRQGIGLFVQMVARNDLIYLAIAGPVHTFLITGEGVQHTYFQENPYELQSSQGICRCRGNGDRFQPDRQGLSRALHSLFQDKVYTFQYHDCQKHPGALLVPELGQRTWI